MLVNATNQGMVGEPPLDLALDSLPASALVSDIIYIPRETKLVAAARKRGNPTMNGLGMLLHQARPAFQAWFGIMPDVTPELRAMIEATARASVLPALCSNIALALTKASRISHEPTRCAGWRLGGAVDRDAGAMRPCLSRARHQARRSVLAGRGHRC